MGILLLGCCGQHLLHYDLVIRQTFINGGALDIGGGVGLEALQYLQIAWKLLQRPYQTPEIVLHILLDPQILLFLLLLNDLPVPLLLLHRSMRPKLHLHLRLLDQQVQHLRGELLQQRLIELQLRRVVDLIKLNNKVTV